MSKWEDSFKKTSVDGDSNACQCTSNQGLFVPNRQLSVVVAGLLFLSFCIFITGYFLGKKKVTEQYVQDMKNNALDDSRIASNDRAHGDDDLSLVTNENSNGGHDSMAAHEIFVQQESIATINQDIVIPDATEQKRYYAQLIGFGTEKSAQQFVNKLSLNGIVTEIRKRMSKTVKGRTSYWYQVVTTAYSDKNDLSLLVDKLVKEEKLKDVCIRVC